MAFVPEAWANGPDGLTPVTAERLTRIEEGLAAAYRDTFDLAPIDLGSIIQGSGYHWFVIADVPVRALVTRLKVQVVGVSTWSIQVSSLPSGAGEVMFEAVGIGESTYSISWPWWYKNDQTPTALTEMYFGITNFSGPTADFTITDLRGEALA